MVIGEQDWFSRPLGRVFSGRGAGETGDHVKNFSATYGCKENSSLGSCVALATAARPVFFFNLIFATPLKAGNLWAQRMREY